MLDNETKRRIDTARDILVGKVPDPKSQVEQITIALIYKFMDDMDKEAKELGGKENFFSGEFEKYSWSSIFDPKLGGHDLIVLYGEALEKINQNPNIPELFRNIFKNAYLPYKDPETLKSFLKIINDFTYEHSEKLGDAFEYLLSILGSQGDAGQFRTPRHIIDFIVEILEPKKNETILDPACGTAGFLISSFKHILKNNTEERIGDLLTPDERNRLINNFAGYDISPDMVRLSLVNLYLHGFSNPKIYEYDTLSSEDKWEEIFDVIIANPPFMSPKGGIKPHKRFSIQANRSEVLFIDYIAEHISVNGRAGIIVPEGIIFQSGNAYKQLRKMLVENYLYAVISLPSGVFNPYSGVKTSILLMDRQLAKKSDNILFIKISNDGFNLGAQRKPIEKNDLPLALEILKNYKSSLLNNSLNIDATDIGGINNIDDIGVIHELPLYQNQYTENQIFSIVPKLKISKNGDYNLSMDRYKEDEQFKNTKYDLVELGEVCKEKPQYGSSASKEKFNNKIRYIRITDIDENGRLKFNELVSPSIIEENCFLNINDLLFARSGSVGRSYIHLSNDLIYQFAGYLIRFKANEDKAVPKYIFYITKSNQYYEWVENIKKSGTLSNINAKEYSSFKFPLPPIEVQKQIVEEIEGYQKIIDGARQVVENYKPKIKINPDWEIVELGKIFHKVSNSINPQEHTGIIDYIGLENIESNTGNLVGDIKTEVLEIKSTKTKFSKKDILYGKLRPNLNKVWFSNLSGICSTDILVFRTDKENVLPKFYFYILLSQSFNAEVLKGLKGSQLPRVSFDYISTLKIPLPPIEIQKQIVEQIEKEQSLVESNKELINIFEQKIKDKIGEVWGND